MIKVFSLKEIIKNIFKIIIPLIITYFSFSFIINGVYANKDEKKFDKAMIGVIEDNIGLIKTSENENKPKEWGKEILDSEFEIIDEIKKTDNNNESLEKIEVNDENIVMNEKKDEKDIIENDVKTEEIPNEVQPRFNVEYNGVKINNSTEYELTEEIMNTDNLNVNKSNAIIYHTHTCESYTPTEEYNYEMNGNYRTTDLEYTVAKVGDELENYLLEYNWNVIHNKTCHDYPSYNGSYSRSLNTVKDILNNSNETDILIDLHRDAIADSNYAPKVKIGDEIVSQLMFVIGTDITIPEHKNWNQNLKFAIKVQQKANELYPGLFKPIILRNSAYNQYLGKGACIIEVGATGNTLEESCGAMKYLAKILNEL